MLALVTAISTGGRLALLRPASLTDILTPALPCPPPSLLPPHILMSATVGPRTSLRHLLHSTLSVIRRRESEKRMLRDVVMKMMIRQACVTFV